MLQTEQQPQIICSLMIINSYFILVCLSMTVFSCDNVFILVSKYNKKLCSGAGPGVSAGDQSIYWSIKTLCIKHFKQSALNNEKL